MIFRIISKIRKYHWLDLISTTPRHSTPISNVLPKVIFSFRNRIASNIAKSTEVSRSVYTIDIGACKHAHKTIAYALNPNEPPTQKVF